MPRYYERRNGGTPYVKGSVQGAFVTWQVTREGAQELRRRGYRHEDEISSDLVNYMVSTGEMYTNSGGVSNYAEDSWQRPTRSQARKRPRRIRINEEPKPRAFWISTVFMLFLGVIVFWIALPFWLIDSKREWAFTTQVTEFGESLFEPANWAAFKLTEEGFQAWKRAGWAVFILFLLIQSCN